MFIAVDIKFFEEYKEVMCPVAMSLDLLQGEAKAYMGQLLPTVASVLRNLQSKQKDDLQYCEPLLNSLIQGFQNR